MLFIVSCKPSIRELAEQCVRKQALSPSTLKFINYTDTLLPARIEFDTLYHIASVIGNADCFNEDEWWFSTAIYTDSIRIDERHYPEHYYCIMCIDAINEYGVPIRDFVDVVVMNGEAITSNEYYERCNEIVSSKSFAQIDTLTDVRDHLEFKKENNRWEKKQRLFHLISNP